MRPRAMLSATAMVTSLAVAVVRLAACASAQPQDVGGRGDREAQGPHEGAGRGLAQRPGQGQGRPDPGHRARRREAGPDGQADPGAVPRGLARSREVGGQARDLAEEERVRRGGQEPRDVVDQAQGHRARPATPSRPRPSSRTSAARPAAPATSRSACRPSSESRRTPASRSRSIVAGVAAAALTALPAAAAADTISFKLLPRYSLHHVQERRSARDRGRPHRGRRPAGRR